MTTLVMGSRYCLYRSDGDTLASCPSTAPTGMAIYGSAGQCTTITPCARWGVLERMASERAWQLPGVYWGIGLGRERGARMDGIFSINKAPGMTSHDVVARVRRLAQQKRVGHAGTLDPNA